MIILKVLAGLLIAALLIIFYMGWVMTGRSHTPFPADAPVSFHSKPDQYHTPFGIIEAGFTKDKVSGMLGVPDRRSSSEQDDIWFYTFDDYKRVNVCFENGEVSEVIVRDAPGKKNWVRP